ncbi:hypothetical protein [Actinoplanes sp. L3-i22]|uniref:hypothetical protein n=1 Tax=Actinoplanes sp. L3-i22 TaxID=2836373 RepID=UPI001C777E40|nr:hypothetical protein [Actinoplanes sp. L3-i22]BCY10506.1 hypothetical protein L3i22_055940 [Actinoplanes sp. L3-i22]
MPANTWNFRSVRDLRRASLDTGVEVDFGAGVHLLPSWTTALDLRPLVPADGPVDWTALDRLPKLVSVSWSGPDRGLTGVLAAQPRIQYLEWFDAQGDLDLRQSAVLRLWINCAGLSGVLLPESLAVLLVQNPRENLRIETRDDRRRLALHLAFDGAEAIIPAGLRATPVVRLGLGGEFSVKALESFTGLRDLTCEFEAPPGRLIDLPLLGQHPGLTRLCLINAYDLDPMTMPDLPCLSTVELVGTRAEIAARLELRFQGRERPQVSARYARPFGEPA